jgi:chromosome segregation ATPase
MAVLFNVDSVKPKGSTKIFFIQTTDHFNSTVSIKLPFATQIEKLSRDVEDKKQAVTALQLMKDTETKKLEEKIATLKSDRNDVSQRLDQEKSTCSKNINNLQFENHDLRTRENNCNVMNSGLVEEKAACSKKINDLQFENHDLRTRENNCNAMNSIAESEKKQCLDNVVKLEVDNKDLFFKAWSLDGYTKSSQSKDQV